MKLYLNTCEPAEAREIYSWGILDGVTTNPSMTAAIKRDYVKNLKEICAIGEMDVFAQVVSEKAEDIVKEAKALAGIHKSLTVKVHTNPEGIKAIKELKRQGIRTCATGLHSVLEAVAVAKAGAGHAAMFIGLLGEVDEHATDELIATIRTIYDEAGFDTQIMGAVRSASQLVQSLSSGADEITCSYKIWQQFFANHHTHDRWNAFIGDWKKAYGDRNWITGY